MIKKILKFVALFALLSSCSSGYDYYDYNYANYSYRQVIRFSDTNRVIKQINYFDGLKIDYPNSSAANLKISPNENTRFELSDGTSKYTFEVKMKFKMDDESDEYNDEIFVKKLDKIEVVQSSAKKIRQAKSEITIVGVPFSYSRTFEFIDSLIIE